MYRKAGFELDWLNSISMSLLSKNLDGLWARQQAISDNLANVETPGYKSKSVSFEDQLQAQLQDDSRSKQDMIQGIQSVDPATTVSEGTLRADGSNVDVEKENINLARTQLDYAFSLQGLTDQFARLRIAISGK